MGRAISRLEAFAGLHPWVPASVAVLALVGVVGSLKVGTDTPKRTELVNINGHEILQTTGGSSTPGWAFGLTFASVVVAAFAIVLLIEGMNRRSLRSGDRRRARIERLSASLTDALTTIESIKSEVADGERVLARLESEVETATQLAQLSSEEAKAVLAQMKETVRAATSRSTWVQVVINVVLFLAGVVITLLWTR
jgi:ABC-type multidrug transport system fused ATPase/permease subunit